MMYIVNVLSKWMIIIFRVSGAFRHLSPKSCGFPAIRLQQGRSGGASQAAFPKPDGVGELLNWSNRNQITVLSSSIFVWSRRLKISDANSRNSCETYVTTWLSELPCWTGCGCGLGCRDHCRAIGGGPSGFRIQAFWRSLGLTVKATSCYNLLQFATDNAVLCASQLTVPFIAHLRVICDASPSALAWQSKIGASYLPRNHCHWVWSLDFFTGKLPKCHQENHCLPRKSI